MKKAIIVTGLILGLYSCTQTKYFVRTEAELQQVDWKRNAVNYIPVMESDLKRSSILDTTYQFIINEEYAKLKQYLSAVESESPDYYLAKTLYQITKTDYERAMVALNKIREKRYEMLKNLLSVDLSYELAKGNDSREFKKFLQDYQSLMDKYPDNELLKEIITLRIRYIRYHY